MVTGQHIADAAIASFHLAPEIRRLLTSLRFWCIVLILNALNSNILIAYLLWRD